MKRPTKNQILVKQEKVIGIILRDRGELLAKNLRAAAKEISKAIKDENLEVLLDLLDAWEHK